MAYQIIASQDTDAVYPETELRPRITAVLDSEADVQALSGTEKWSPGSLAILAEAGFPTLILSASRGWVNGNTGGAVPGGDHGDTSAPSDWNAAEGEPGHVLNRTHWVEESVFASEENAIFAKLGDTSFARKWIPLSSVAADWLIALNGIEYKIGHVTVAGYNPSNVDAYYGYGNPALVESVYNTSTWKTRENYDFSDNGLPFAIIREYDGDTDSEEYWLYVSFEPYWEEVIYTYSVLKRTFHPLDPQFLPGATEEWTFTLEDGSTVTKKVMVVSE